MIDGQLAQFDGGLKYGDFLLFPPKQVRQREAYANMRKYTFSSATEVIGVIPVSGLNSAWQKMSPSTSCPTRLPSLLVSGILAYMGAGVSSSILLGAFESR